MIAECPKAWYTEGMTLTVIIQQDSDGWFLGSIPSLHGCRTQAKSLPELYERLKEVALLCLEEQKVPDTELRLIGVQNIDLPALA